jgi:hypothetical protein
MADEWEASAMEDKIDVKESFIETAVDGLRRVAENIAIAPSETPIGVIEATVERYRNLACEFLDEAEADEWVTEVVARFEAELKDLQLME